MPYYLTKMRLEKLNENYITYSIFESICMAERVTDDDAIAELSSFLNDLGTIVHFDEPVLRDTNVINPSWITRAVYKIITSKALADGHGVIDTEQVGTILARAGQYRRQRDYVIELMKRFQLCFSLPDGRILFPDLLDIAEPRIDFEQKNALRYRIEYGFFPKSIMPRLLVKLHSDIKDKLMWRTGAVLHEPVFGVSALIRADRKDKVIQVYVTGKERREYLSIIRKALLDITASLRGLDFKEKIPCICSQCTGENHPFYFDYHYLLKRRREGCSAVDCQRSIESVPLDKLLEDVEPPDSELDGWDVFVSYANNDFKEVTSVIDDLKNHKIKVWWDKEQIKPGYSITKTIEMGLRRSRYIMLCLSRNQLESGWSRAEFGGVLGKILSGQTSQKVVPLIIDDMDRRYGGQ